MKTEVTHRSFQVPRREGGSDPITATLHNQPKLCFRCCVARNMGMALKVLQASKLLLKSNAPKAQVVRGINIARGLVQDLVEHVGSNHKCH